MHRIDLNLLAQLSALLQTRSVTQAAARMGISQPAMSRSLAELRRLFGDPLLVRTRGGMLLTQRAEELMKPLQDWLAEVGRIVIPQAVEPPSLVRRFRIVAGDFGIRAVIAPALPAIMEAAPGVAIDIIAGSGEARERLASGEADLALAAPPKDRHLIHDRLLLREDHVCLLRSGHPLAIAAGARELLLADFLCWPHIAVGPSAYQDALDRTLLARGLDRRVVATLPSLAAAAALLPRCHAIIFAPATAAADHAADERLSSIAPPAELGRHEHWALWHNRTHRDPAVQWLIELLARRCGGGAVAANDPTLTPFTLAAAE